MLSKCHVSTLDMTQLRCPFLLKKETQHEKKLLKLILRKQDLINEI